MVYIYICINTRLHAYAKVCIDAGIPSCAGQVFVLFVGNMQTRAGVTESLGKAIIYDINNCTPYADSHQEVVRLDVAMYIVLVVHILYPA